MRFGQRDLLRRDLVLLVGDDLPAAEGLELAGFAVDLDANIDVVLEALLGGRSQGELERAEHDVLLDVLFARQRIDQHQQLAAHS